MCAQPGFDRFGQTFPRTQSAGNKPSFLGRSAWVAARLGDGALARGISKTLPCMEVSASKSWVGRSFCL